MRFLHISDLHLGKQVADFSLLEDQRYILRQVLDIAVERGVQAVVLAGDLYDKAVPPTDAVTVLDRFMTALSERGIPLLMISGNHDSPERLDFGSSLLSARGVYLAGAFEGKPRRVTIGEGEDAANFYLLPFIRPGNVRAFYPEEDIHGYDDAMRCVIRHTELSEERPNVLVAHQFVTAGGISPERSDSEVLSLGGTDNVDVSNFLSFTYVALGHIHRPQRLTRDSVRYAGSPLKYSFSEAAHQKSAVLVTLSGRSEPEIELIPLSPLHDMREIKGPMEALLSDTVVHSADPEDYLHVTLTDSEPVPDALHRLRQVYPNIMRLDFSAHEQAEEQGDLTAGEVERKSPAELFDDFYSLMQGEAPDDEEKALIRRVMAEIWDGEKTDTDKEGADV